MSSAFRGGVHIALSLPVSRVPAGSGAPHGPGTIIPLLRPIVFFNLVLQIIGAFQSFAQAFIVSGGTVGQSDSTTFFTLYLYQKGFGQFDIGYASAMVWVLLLMVVAALITVHPLLWMLASPLRANDLVVQDPSVLLKAIHVQNCCTGRKALPDQFHRYLVNPAIAVLGAVMGNLVSCSMAAYAFAGGIFREEDTLRRHAVDHHAAHPRRGGAEVHPVLADWLDQHFLAADGPAVPGHHHQRPGFHVRHVGGDLASGVPVWPALPHQGHRDNRHQAEPGPSRVGAPRARAVLRTQFAAPAGCGLQWGHDKPLACVFFVGSGGARV